MIEYNTQLLRKRSMTVSEGIRLSDELISNIFQAIARHDPAAGEDMMLGLQYLSAITGYLSAGFPGSEQERGELLDGLAAFTRHVCNEQVAARTRSAQAAAPKGRSIETDDPAVGIWVPE